MPSAPTKPWMPSKTSPPNKAVASLVLASQSPARSALLQQIGCRFTVVPSQFTDDPTPPQNREPALLAMDLALKKAAFSLVSRPKDVILSADTIGILPLHHSHDTSLSMVELLGKPQSIDQARAMLRRLSGQTHHIVTGVALRQADGSHQEAFADITQVTWGHVDSATLEAYLASQSWVGKAGGYSLADIIARHWPVSLIGDPTTVQGLPMQRLMPRLTAWGVYP